MKPSVYLPLIILVLSMFTFTTIMNETSGPIYDTSFEIQSDISVDSVFETETQSSFIQVDQEFEYDRSFIESTELISGNDSDVMVKVVRDSIGNEIQLAITESTDLPTKNAYQENSAGAKDLYIRKNNVNGITEWATYFGGSSNDWTDPNQFNTVLTNKFADIAIDNLDNVIVVGSTLSSDFPVKDAFNSSALDAVNGFVSKFYPNGTLMWSTYLSGSFQDWITSVATASDGSIYVGGNTDSDDFPFVQNKNEGSFQDAFIIKISSNGTLLWGNIISRTISGGEEEINNLVVGDDDTVYGSGTLDRIGDSARLLIGFTKDGSLKFESVWMNTVVGPGDKEVINNFLVLSDLSLSYHSSGLLVIVASAGTSETDELWQGVHFFTDEGEKLAEFQMPFTIAKIGTGVLHPDGDRVILAVEITLDKSQSIEFMNDYLDFSDIPEGFSGSGIFLFEIDLTGTIQFATLLSLTEVRAEDTSVGIISMNMPSHKMIEIVGTVSGSNGELSSLLSEDQSIDNLDDQIGFRMSIYHPTEDEDSDFISNWYEYTNSLDMFNQSDGFGDLDNDRLPTSTEALLGLDHQNNDTDNDGMLDGWEYENGLNPLIDDSMSDEDGDNLPNLGEYALGLDPHIFRDGNGDFDFDGLPNWYEYMIGTDIYTDTDQGDEDEDGLTNLYEFEKGLNATNRDTDGDGEIDGDEVSNGTDPLDAASNYARIELELSQQRRERNILLWILGSTIFIAVFGLVQWRRISRRRSEEAKKKGFQSYGEVKEARVRGFENSDEQSKSLKLGILHKKAYSLLTLGGDYDTVTFEKRKDDLFSGILEIYDFIETNETEFRSHISDVRDPMELADLIKQGEEIVDRLDTRNENMQSWSDLFENLEQIASTENTRLLSSITNLEITEISSQLESVSDEVVAFRQIINNIIHEKTVWFEPWGRLINFLSVVEENTPVNIEYIAQTINCKVEQVEAFITGIIDQNPGLGRFDHDQTVFMRETNTMKYIQEYIERAKDLIGDNETV